MATNGNGTPEPAPQPQPTGGQSAGGLFGIPTMWLLIGGAGAGVVVLLVVIVVAVLVSLPGGGPPSPNELLGFVPADSDDVLILDVAAILEGEAPEEYQEAIMSAYEAWEDTGFSFQYIDSMIEFYNREEGYVMYAIKGDFEFEDIRATFDDIDYEMSEYREFEVWEGDSWQYRAIVLIEEDDYVLLANYQQALRTVIKNLHTSSGSLLEEESSPMKELLDETGKGWLRHPVVGDCNAIQRCEGLAYTLTKRDLDSANLRATMLFSSERSAEKAANEYDDVYDFLSDSTIYGANIEVHTIENDGNYIHVEGIAHFEEPQGSTNTPETHEPTTNLQEKASEQINDEQLTRTYIPEVLGMKVFAVEGDLDAEQYEAKWTIRGATPSDIYDAVIEHFNEFPDEPPVFSNRTDIMVAILFDCRPLGNISLNGEGRVGFYENNTMFAMGMWSYEISRVQGDTPDSFSISGDCFDTKLLRASPGQWDLGDYVVEYLDQQGKVIGDIEFQVATN